MYLFRLDSVGIAGFGHDFGTLDGKYPAIVEVFDALGSTKRTGLVAQFLFLLVPIFPWLIKLPTGRNKLLNKLRVAMCEIADELLARTRSEKEGRASEENSGENSVIGLLSEEDNLGVVHKV